MRISQSFLAASALFILVGCGGSGGGGSLGGFSVATLAGQATIAEGPTDTASVSLVGLSLSSSPISEIVSDNSARVILTMVITSGVWE